MSTRRARLLAAILALAIASPLALGSASGDVSHVGWPHTVTVWFAAEKVGQTGIGTDGNDMLLGGDGSDTIRGGPGDDVIWGDRLPSPNGPDQTDRLLGGAGSDWIYTSHGVNHVFAGPGNDHVFASFGRGTIDCGPGADVLTMDRSDEHSYAVTGCERIRIATP